MQLNITRLKKLEHRADNLPEYWGDIDITPLLGRVTIYTRPLNLDLAVKTFRAIKDDRFENRTLHTREEAIQYLHELEIRADQAETGDTTAEKPENGDVAS